MRNYAYEEGWIIPASAGNTLITPNIFRTNADHPRERGEHIRETIELRHKLGSSPRARGTPENRHALVVPTRIIPASAGNTSPVNSSTKTFSDHPRERGEHSTVVNSERPNTGSSPRARGTQNGVALRTSKHRIIPASAGNTSGGTSMTRSPPDHPRERGEHGSIFPSSPHGNGSSPRARGTLLVDEGASGKERIIPASAGNTQVIRPDGRRTADHPRERGEHRMSQELWVGDAGSSPRARGTLPFVLELAHVGRIIPASAGNTLQPTTCRCGRPDHPRERGEHSTIISSMAVESGSSPRARGTRRAEGKI